MGRDPNCPHKSRDHKGHPCQHFGNILKQLHGPFANTWTKVPLVEAWVDAPTPTDLRYRSAPGSLPDDPPSHRLPKMMQPRISGSSFPTVVGFEGHASGLSYCTGHGAQLTARTTAGGTEPPTSQESAAPSPAISRGDPNWLDGGCGLCSGQWAEGAGSHLKPRQRAVLPGQLAALGQPPPVPRTHRGLCHPAHSGPTPDPHWGLV